MARDHQVDVLTTRAIDYVTWRDEYPEGEVGVNGVCVRRFGVDQPRESRLFDEISQRVFGSPHTKADEIRWMKLQGPYSSRLFDYLERNRTNYDVFVFLTYLYCTTYFGLPIVADHAVLVPTAHDEPPIYLGIFDELFRKARYLACNTPEEIAFLRRRFFELDLQAEPVGVGFDPVQELSPDHQWEALRERMGSSEFIVYVGRIDESKGCATLIDFFKRYVAEDQNRDLKLLMVGKPVMEVPDHPRLLLAGFVPETTKFHSIANSRFMVVPSPYESLCFAAIESWLLGKPILANGNCSVLRGQCTRSNGGLWYANYAEFRQGMDCLLGNSSLAETMGRQGHTFAAQNYTWKEVDKKLIRILSSVASSSARASVLQSKFVLGDTTTAVKAAFVIPWYGEHIPGGAESLCRSVVKALLKIGVDAEVLTTCVERFHSDWSHNFHLEGTTVEHGVTVRRFRVRQRDTAAFDRVNCKLMHNIPVTPAEEQMYLTEMINSPDLYEFIRRHRNEYVFLFIPYMFGTTYWGSQACPERSVLIPCLHDEPYARMQVFQRMCESVRGLFFNSREEKRLADRLYCLDQDSLAVVGSPVDCAWSADAQRFRKQYGLSDFLLYAGRTEKGKGADLLVEYFCRYLDDTGRAESLVFIGGGDLAVPYAYRSRIVKLGFIPVQDKYDAYAAATALCVPSFMESFSIVAMESWLAGRPVIVNAQCPVTTDFCRESNGGLFFSSYEEFRDILKLLSESQRLCTTLGLNGRQYVLDNFRPNVVATRYRDALEAWGFRLAGH
jgi:glycosyltransferase involved in cell wall biosynthesis